MLAVEMEISVHEIGAFSAAQLAMVKKKGTLTPAEITHQLPAILTTKRRSKMSNGPSFTSDYYCFKFIAKQQRMSCLGHHGSAQLKEIGHSEEL